MGIFDWPSPLLARFDGVLSAMVGSTGRIAFWSVFASVLSMAVYKLMSNQARLGELKAQISTTKAELNANPPDDYAQALQSSRALLGLSLRHVGHSILPTLLAGLPVVVVFVFLANTFSYRWPEGGAAVPVSVVYEDGHNQSLALAFPYDVATQPLLAHEVSGAGGRPATPFIGKRSAFDLLFANPAGYVRDGSPVREVNLGLDAQRYVGFGPGWLASWEGLFLTVMVTMSLAIKFAFRIQ